MEQTTDRRFNRLMEGITEDNRERMIKAANKFLELIEQKAVPLYQREDRTYTLTNPEEKQDESTSK